MIRGVSWTYYFYQSQRNLIPPIDESPHRTDPSEDLKNKTPLEKGLRLHENNAVEKVDNVL